ncbi:MAG TPA: DUF4173 domain-containing protein [Candidatus Limnocylindrales bacterium]|nr:DUF4173 domain-containing protein [Candidatus Limnocylindrales bacterium]
MEHRTARRALLVAALAGVAAELVFDRQPLGIGVPVFVAGLLALVAWFSPSAPGSARARPADSLDWWLAVVAIAASLGPALRTDPTVVFLDLVLVITATAAFSVAMSGVAVTRLAAEAVVALGVAAAAAMLAAPAWLVRSIAGDGALAGAAVRLGRLAPLVRGIVIAVPIVAGFAFLLGSADAVFGHALDDAFRLSFDIDDVIGRGVFTLIAAALVCGPLAVAAGIAGSAGFPIVSFSSTAAEVEAAAAGPASIETQAARRAGTTEALVVLVAVDVLFAAFTAVQVVFLFGGTDTLAAIGMTYSDYARQGYFQLVGVVALAGLLVMGAHHAVGRTRAFIGAALILLALTALILVSAAVRLALYQGAYGWTELRFFVAASIGWLALSVVSAIVLLAMARMRWLPHALAMSAVAVTLAVSAIGPQAFVMQENVARLLDPTRVAAGGHAGLDLDYGATLGDDAIPSLIASLPALSPSDAETVLVQLRIRYADLRDEARTSGPFSRNLARQRALEELTGLFAPESG